MAAGAADDICGASAAIKQPPIRNIFALFMFSFLSGRCSACAQLDRNCAMKFLAPEIFLF
jgi:hypothetical protein